MQRPPTILLDTTLDELYQQDNPASERIVHVFCGASCTFDLTPDFPRNVKYVYQESACGTEYAEDVNESVRQAMAIKHLSLSAQRYAFIAGCGPVILFHTGGSEDCKQHDLQEVSTTLAVLASEQRASPVCCLGPAHLQNVLREHAIQSISSPVAVDAISEIILESEGVINAVVDCDKMWYLNSKEALATSGLPTPKTMVVEVEEFEDEAQWCTPGYDSLKVDKEFDPDYKSEWSNWLHSQITTVIRAVTEHDVPFVLNVNQSSRGSGTFVVESEAARAQLIEHLLTGGHLKNLLSSITVENEHLHLGSIMLSELVTNPIANIDLNFFVAASGRATFLGASKHTIGQETAEKERSTIVYSRQDEFKGQVEKIMNQTAFWLHEHGYLGPVGADLLQTQEGELLIVDLKVRTSEAFCLPLLKTHFTSRGLDAAATFSITTKESREVFIERWHEDFEAGSMCIVSWYDAPSLGESYGGLVVGAEDEGRLREAVGRIRETCEGLGV